GSPAEINLLDGDLVNLWLARAAGIPAVVVGDIDRGGVFASLFGTVALLPDDLRSCVKAFVINKFRGDPALLGPGLADLAALPGTKATVADLAWLRAQGLAVALAALPPSATVLGICGGYQMLGRTIDDGVESGAGAVAGLGRLPARTRFEPTKVTRPRHGRALDRPVGGYQIHHGRTTSDAPWIELDDGWGTGAEGAASPAGGCLGTSLHRLFHADA